MVWGKGGKKADPICDTVVYAQSWKYYWDDLRKEKWTQGKCSDSVITATFPGKIEYKAQLSLFLTSL